MIRLLVVDDSALMRKLLGGVFAQEPDFELAFARDGDQALAEHARFRPDVITLDVNMPGLDGLACLDRIMLDRPTPVVMVSSLTADGAEVTLDAMERGAVDFVAKPGGAVSLEIDRLGPLIVQKVRAAARARLRPTLRLAERIRARAPPRPAARRGRHARRATVPSPAAPPTTSPAPGPVEGVVLVGTSTGGPPALDALLSRLPADFRGRSWSHSTCPAASPGPWHAGSTACAPCGCRKPRGRCRWLRATSTSAGGTRT